MSTPPALKSSSAPTGRIARSFLALASGDGLARVIAFGAQVYIANRLGPAMLGVVGFANAVLLYFRNTAQCGVDLLGVRKVAEDREHMPEVVPAILGCRTLIAFGLATVLAAASMVFLPSPEAEVLAIYALTLLTVGPDSRWVHTGFQDTRPVAIARVLGELLFVVSVLLLVHAPEHIERVPLAQFAGDALTTVLLFVWLGRLGLPRVLRWDWSLALPTLRRGLPLVGNVLLGLTIYNSDLIFLRIFRDLDTVGFYSAAYQLISFLINMAMAYSISLLPSLTQAAREGSATRDGLYHDAHAQSFAVGLAVAIGGAFTAGAIMTSVFGEEFGPSEPALAILIWTVPFMLSKEVDLIALLVRGREAAVLRMTAWAVLVNVLLNLVLIPRYGILGAALSTLLTEIARAVIARLYASAEGYPALSLKRLARSLLAGSAMVGAYLLMTPSSVWSGLALGIATYLGALAATGGFRLRGRLPVLNV